MTQATMTDGKMPDGAMTQATMTRATMADGTMTQPAVTDRAMPDGIMTQAAMAQAAMTQAAHHYLTFETASGFCAIAWNDAGIARFQLPTKTAAAAERLLLRRLPDARAGTPTPEVAGVIAAAQRYFAGEQTDFAMVRLDLSGQEDLFQRIYTALRRVGWGETTTYGTLAKAIGAGPEVARDVGQAMARNPVPLIIPCHRVLAAGNKVGGFSAPGGAAMKARMLGLEGVQVEGVTVAPAQQSLAL